jgi:hypothetical protein
MNFMNRFWVTITYGWKHTKGEPLLFKKGDVEQIW